MTHEFKLQLLHSDLKKCFKCGLEKDLSEFSKQNKGNQCKVCTRKYRRERYERQDVKIKEKQQFLKTYFKRAYGITLEIYQEMFLSQNGLCAICLFPEKFIDKRSNKPRMLAVDHCHISGKVRGLLCRHCNQAIGIFKDDTDRLARAIAYLRNNK